MTQNYKRYLKYYTPSGLGGVFPVNFIRTDEHGDLFKVNNPQSDFNGKEYYLKSDEVFDNAELKRFSMAPHTIGSICQSVYNMGKITTRDEALTKIETALRINHLYVAI